MQNEPSASSKQSPAKKTAAKKTAAKKTAAKKTATKKTARKTAKRQAARKTKAHKRAKRYTDELKKQILDFVESVGRGGATKAAKKFGVSPLSISNWKKKLGGGGQSAKPRASTTPGSRDQVLARMISLSAEMAANEKKHAAMQKEFEQLKARL